MNSLPSSKTLILTDAAKKDLASIATYTKKTWGDKQKIFYISKLRQSFSKACINHQLGKVRNDLYPKLQALQSQKHIFFYLIRGDKLYIVRVLHQNMGIEAQFNKH